MESLNLDSFNRKFNNSFDVQQQFSDQIRGPSFFLNQSKQPEISLASQQQLLEDDPKQFHLLYFKPDEKKGNDYHIGEQLEESAPEPEQNDQQSHGPGGLEQKQSWDFESFKIQQSNMSVGHGKVSPVIRTEPSDETVERVIDETDENQTQENPITQIEGAKAQKTVYQQCPHRFIYKNFGEDIVKQLTAKQSNFFKEFCQYVQEENEQKEYIDWLKSKDGADNLNGKKKFVNALKVNRSESVLTQKRKEILQELCRVYFENKYADHYIEASKKINAKNKTIYRAFIPHFMQCLTDEEGLSKRWRYSKIIKNE